MSENYIIVEGVNEKKLESVLMDLANLYADIPFVDGMQLYRQKENYNSFLILFSNQPDLDRFSYFVNYINYPSGYEEFSPFIKGFFKTSNIEKNYEFKIGEWLMIYISKKNKEYDNVNIINVSNDNYLFDFGGRVKKLASPEEMYTLIPCNKNDYHHIIDIIPSKSAEKMETKPWWKFW